MQRNPDRTITAILSFALLIAVTSCVERADLDTGERAIVVNCILDASKDTQHLEIMYTRPLGSSKNEYPENCKATISECDSLWRVLTTRNFQKDTGANYIIDLKPKAYGTNYIITVDIEGHRQITARTTTVQLEKLEPGRIIDNDSSLVIRFIYHPEPFWLYVTDSQGKMATALAEAGTICKVDRFNLTGEDLYAATGVVRNGVKSFAQSKEEWFLLAQRGDGSGFFDFLLNLDFSTESFPLHRNFLRMEYLGPMHTPIFPNDIVLGGDVTPNSTVHFFFANKDLDLYLKDVVTEGMKRGNMTDFTDIFRVLSIYSNIEGGCGIFGSMISTETTGVTLKEYD